MQTFKFNDVKLGPTYGWNVMVQAPDSSEAMKKFIAMDAEEWRRPQWRLIAYRPYPFFAWWQKS